MCLSDLLIALSLAMRNKRRRVLMLTVEELKRLKEHKEKVETAIHDAEQEIKKSSNPTNPDAETKQKVEMQIRDVVESVRDTEGNVVQPSELRKAAFLENKKTLFDDTVDYDTKYYRENWTGKIEDIMYITTKDPHIRVLQQKANDVYMLSKIKGWIEGTHYTVAAKSLSAYAELQNEIDSFKKALGTATSGEGADWIPTQYAAEMVDEVRLNLMVAAAHRTIQMPTDPYTTPIKIGRSTAYLASEALVDAPSELRKSQFQTGNVTFTAKTLAVAVPFSFEFDEDSIVPVLPAVRSDIALAIAEGIENATINGDTSAAHQDTGLTVESDDQLKAFDGYRKLAVSTAKVDFNTGTEDFSTANFRAVRKAMGKYGVKPQQLMWVVSIQCYIRMLGLPEVLTLDKYGSATPILTGELGRFDNIPVVVSEFVRSDLSASGIYDGVTTTKTEAILVHVPSFWYGERREITIETVRLPLAQQNVMIATQRIDFQPVRPATDALVGIGYDISS